MNSLMEKVAKTRYAKWIDESKDEFTKRRRIKELRNNGMLAGSGFYHFPQAESSPSLKSRLIKHKKGDTDPFLKHLENANKILKDIEKNQDEYEKGLKDFHKKLDNARIQLDSSPLKTANGIKFDVKDTLSKSKGLSTKSKVGLGLAGATALGALGYGAYKAHQKHNEKVAEVVDYLLEKTAGEDVFYHASPVQDIKKFKRFPDTSGNNKGKVTFASKEPSFAAAFGVKWNDGIARLSTETKDTKGPNEDNYLGTILKYTDKVNVDKPCSMYKLKGKFNPLRYNKDIEYITNQDVQILSEEKFKTFREMAKTYGLKLNHVSEEHILAKLKGKKSSNFEKK